VSNEGKRINCAKCNKPLKRVKRYYRNGKYYCNKKCFASAMKKDAASQQS
jgi:hypothetical protein